MYKGHLLYLYFIIQMSKPVICKNKSIIIGCKSSQCLKYRFIWPTFVLVLLQKAGVKLLNSGSSLSVNKICINNIEIARLDKLFFCSALLFPTDNKGHVLVLTPSTWYELKVEQLRFCLKWPFILTEYTSFFFQSSL